MVSLSVLVVLLCVQTAIANVEKAIFLGPATVNVPLQHPSLEDLNIDVLTPSNFSLRTHLKAAFPTDGHESGKATWLLLDSLSEDQRYEVRVCWAATQPTDFLVNTYELPTVWDTPELITSLWEYSMSRQPQDAGEEPAPKIHRASSGSDGERQASLLFLQILAAANYYTTNATLMSDVPPVYVDIILDPFLLNVLPRSLAPTGAFIVVVAIVSYFVARRAVSWVQTVARGNEAEREKKEQ